MSREGVPLHGMGYGDFPAQPGGPRVNENTTVTIDIDPPKDHIVMSLCNFVYINPCCLGLAALIYSIKSRDRRIVGDLEGARHYTSLARKYNSAAHILVAII
ncbi:dispanin subfamily A member 2b-like [Halichoeres trimaculatus]|uniref:dispanin subfamily A member 2b-like n=1 Tax=Halichoeres trimaculatus TaxID=147232 RepID=UPI003D9DC744